MKHTLGKRTMIDNDPKKILAKELEDYETNFVYIVNITPEKYHLTRTALLEQLLNRLEQPVLYVTLNLPSKTIISGLKENRINSSRLMIVEGMSQKTGLPLSLVELSIKITTLVNSGKYYSMVFDSASTLLVSNNPKTTEMFLSFIINKLRLINMHGIIIFINDEKSIKVANIISQACDKYINV